MTLNEGTDGRGSCAFISGSSRDCLPFRRCGATFDNRDVQAHLPLRFHIRVPIVAAGRPVSHRQCPECGRLREIPWRLEE